MLLLTRVTVSGVWQKRAPQIGKLADGTVKIGNAANAVGDIGESVTNLSN